ncbi:MAG TPA: hypothetical protein ENH62_13825 [Marinobacter sp.]|nr:hypothetical protein [Marinobacter sp.]
METKRIMVWRALLDGECKQIQISEESLWHELKNDNAWYDSAQHDQWSITSQEEELPVVKGEAHDWGAEGGCGGVHIHWRCPLCQELHLTDRSEPPPGLWFCEKGKGIAIVEWKDIEQDAPADAKRPRR